MRKKTAVFLSILLSLFIVLEAFPVRLLAAEAASPAAEETVFKEEAEPAAEAEKAEAAEPAAEAERAEETEPAAETEKAEEAEPAAEAEKAEAAEPAAEAEKAEPAEPAAEAEKAEEAEPAAEAEKAEASEPAAEAEEAGDEAALPKAASDTEAVLTEETQEYKITFRLNGQTAVRYTNAGDLVIPDVTEVFPNADLSGKTLRSWYDEEGQRYYFPGIMRIFDRDTVLDAKMGIKIRWEVNNLDAIEKTSDGSRYKAGISEVGVQPNDENSYEIFTEGSTLPLYVSLKAGYEFDGPVTFKNGGGQSFSMKNEYSDWEGYFTVPKQDDVLVVKVKKESRGIAIDEAHFEDAVFRNYIKENFDTDGNGYLSDGEREAVSIINLDREPNDNTPAAASLKGLRYFPKLTHLYCQFNELDYIPFTGLDELIFCDCSGNPLQEECYIYSVPKLEDFRCRACGIKELHMGDVPCLTYLDCASNSLTTLDVRYLPGLVFLYAENNDISEILLGNKPSLAYARFYGNPLQMINVTTAPLLTGAYQTGERHNDDEITQYIAANAMLEVGPNTYIKTDGIPVTYECFPDPVFRQYVSDNFDTYKDGYLTAPETEAVSMINIDREDYGAVWDLTGIGYFPNLNTLYVKNHNLDSVDLSGNPYLYRVDLSDNNIRTIDVSKNENLVSLILTKNEITELDVLNNPELDTLYVAGNQLETLDLSGCPELIKTVETGEKTRTNLGYHYKRLREEIATHVAYSELDIDEDLILETDTASKGIPITGRYFPDEAFRNYIAENLDPDGNHFLSEEEIANVTELYTLRDQGIKSLEGISYFTSLWFFDCAGNEIEKLDVSGMPALTEFNCAYNGMTELILGDSQVLERVICYNNDLTAIDTTHLPALIELQCSGNPELKSLDMTKNSKLLFLWCGSCGLSKIDVSKNPELIELRIGDNPISALNGKNNKKLEVLDITSTGIKTVDLSVYPDLVEFDSLHNALTGVDFSKNTKLKHADMRSSGLTALDLTNNPEMETLAISGNKIASVDLYPCPMLIKAVTKGTKKSLSDGSVQYEVVDDEGFGDQYYWVNADPNTVLNTKPVPLTGIKLNKIYYEIAAKKTGQLTVTYTPANASNKKLVWKSSNPKIAEVDANGKITAKTMGVVTITATSAENSKITKSCRVRVLFADVTNKNYKPYEAIYALADKGIVKGYGWYFAPNDDVTRGQVVTFLWRAAGSPNPKTTGTPFKDVPKTHVYYKAILWANENKIALGYSNGTFKPDQPCTRGEIVTFIWRYLGRPKPKNGTKEFPDVPKKHKYHDQILWAAGAGVTTGFSDGKFKPDETCTRGQCAAFLYRAIK